MWALAPEDSDFLCSNTLERKEKLMKLATSVLFIFLIVMSWPHSAVTQTQQKPEEIAQKSVEAWLALTDSGKYAGSWETASSGFKAAVTKDTWVSKLQSVRTPLGAVNSRKLKSARYAKNPPTAPEGEYVILTYSTRFEQFPSAVETVSAVLDKDGEWRAAGYYIKPASD